MTVTASGAVVEKRPDVVDKFVAALVKADAGIKQDPADAQQIVLGNMRGVMPLPALQEMWKEMEFQVKLDQSLTALLADEAGWIVDRGMVKADKPPAATFRKFIVDAPLKRADPASVTLP